MSLVAPYDPDNVFAKILRGELPCARVFEDDVALAFMDVFPQEDGHTLVVPKQARARTFLDLPPELVGPYMERVHRVARAVTAALQPDGLLMTQFNGAPAGQTVFHLHVHLIPRYEGRSLKGHGQAGMADKDALAALAARISAALP